MATLFDLYNQRSDIEKAESKKMCEAMNEQAIALDNGAVLGIIPCEYRGSSLIMSGHEGELIKMDD